MRTSAISYYSSYIFTHSIQYLSPTITGYHSNNNSASCYGLAECVVAARPKRPVANSTNAGLLALPLGDVRAGCPRVFGLGWGMASAVLQLVVCPVAASAAA